VQRDDLAVGGEPPQANEYSHQSSHRHGEREDRRERAQKEQCDSSDASRVADHEVHQANKLGNKENKSENGQSQDGMGDDFAADIFIEQAHLCARPF